MSIPKFTLKFVWIDFFWSLIITKTVARPVFCWPFFKNVKSQHLRSKIEELNWNIMALNVNSAFRANYKGQYNLVRFFFLKYFYVIRIKNMFWFENRMPLTCHFSLNQTSSIYEKFLFQFSVAYLWQLPSLISYTKWLTQSTPRG